MPGRSGIRGRGSCKLVRIPFLSPLGAVGLGARDSGMTITRIAPLALLLLLCGAAPAPSGPSAATAPPPALRLGPDFFRPPQAQTLSPEVAAHRDEAAALGLYRAPRAGALSPGLAAKAAAAPSERVVAWVFLTDKGVGTRAGYRAALAEVRRGLGPHALRRRAALGPGLGLDFRDLPVNPRYVAGLRDLGFTVRRESRWVNAVSVSAEAGMLPLLERLPYVRAVQPVLVLRRPEPPAPAPMTGNGVTSGASVPSDSVLASFYGASYPQLDQIQVLALHKLGYSGAGVRVMMIDTGFRKDHPAFGAARLIAEHDFINNDGNVQNETGDVASQQYHGTGCWGTLGGYAPGTLIGPAFAAEFVLAKTEDVTQEVRSEEDNYVAALEWGDSLGVDVTSASLGYWTFDDSTGYSAADLDGNTAVITVAVDVAAAKGICCVNAAGNEGPGVTTIGEPADADSVVSVGAVDVNGVIQGFSSRGPTADGRIKPEVCARGRDTEWAQAWDLGYGTASGTSLATPLIGGLAALIKEGHPDWTGAQIREALIQTATRSGSPDNAYGYGIARGLDAMDYSGFGGLPAAPARMTLPFALVSPASGALVTAWPPTLVWGASEPSTPGDVVQYRVLVDVDSRFLTADTVAVGADTTWAVNLPLEAGQTYWWRVDAIGAGGYWRRSIGVRSFYIGNSVAVGPGELPGGRGFGLLAAAPNPARGPMQFAWRLPEAERGELDVVAVTGRRVRRFAVTGSGSMTWDGRDQAGVRVPAGIYFYRLVSPSVREARKLVRLP